MNMNYLRDFSIISEFSNSQKSVINDDEVLCCSAAYPLRNMFGVLSEDERISVSFMKVS